MTKSPPGADLLRRHPDVVLTPAATVRKAMEVMTNSRIGLVLVADKSRRLVGIANDADLRRSLLNGVALDAPVAEALNRDPITVPSSASESEVARAFQEHTKSHIPVVDRQRRLVGLVERNDYVIIGARHHSNPVIIMAGGLGKRLGPLTKSTPKPMLPVGDKPILELLLHQFKNSGFNNFILAVNHLADQVIAHFGDGQRFGVHIEYLREKKPLGTVGALSLLEGSIKEPIIVANGDILTKINFSALLDFHKAENALATLCIKSHEVHIPYGVVEVTGTKLRGLVEKPVHRTFVNAGIYVLQPEVLKWIPARRRFDMPDLIAALQKRRKNSVVCCFPIQEYWLDIGEIQTYQRAAADYQQLF